MSSFLTTGVLATSMVAMATVAVSAAPKNADPLDPYRGKARIVVAVAPDRLDPKLAKQRAIFKDMQAGAKERDLVLVEAVGAGPEATALRREFDLGEEFRAVLVGKDGGGKLTSAEPVGPDQLFPLIDSMPMRQNEMRQR